MKYIFMLLIVVVAGCNGPNHSASNRISTAPISQDPTETLPPTGQNNTATDHKVTPKTGSAPTNEQLPTNNTSSPVTDSTARR